MISSENYFTCFNTDVEKTEIAILTGTDVLKGKDKEQDKRLFLNILFIL